jgi:hypothetical protein
MVWSVNDPRGQSHPIPGKVCVVFQEGVTPEDARVFLDHFHPVGVTIQGLPLARWANVVVADGGEDAFIASVLQHPDKVKAAEREMSAILMGEKKG